MMWYHVLMLLIVAGLVECEDAFGVLHDPREGQRCAEEALCEPLVTGTCLGTTIPYRYTSLKFSQGLTNQQQVQVRDTDNITHF